MSVEDVELDCFDSPGLNFLLAVRGQFYVFAQT